MTIKLFEATARDACIYVENKIEMCTVFSSDERTHKRMTIKLKII